MFQIDPNKTKHILTTIEGMNDAQADGLVKMLRPLDDRLKHVADLWIEQHEIVDYAVAGVSLTSIMVKQHVHFLQALIRVNRILGAPDNEREKIARIYGTKINIRDNLCKPGSPPKRQGET